jgi:predicted nucleic acid-binding protein
MTVDDREPARTRLVADADVLAADLLVGDAARTALDMVRAHSWLELVATEPLLEDAEAVVRRLADEALADEWRETIADLATIAEQPPGDHPALAAAYRGNAMHIISLDSRLQSANAGANLRAAMDVSIRSPEAFVSVFDPAAIYELVFGTEYPGPDRDPRA